MHVRKGVVARRKKLVHIRTYTTDKSHGPRRKANGAADPFVRPRAMRRIRNLTTNIAERATPGFGGNRGRLVR